MFCSLGKVKDGFQIDDFRTGIGYGREAVRSQLQVSHIFLYGFGGNLIISVHCYIL